MEHSVKVLLVLVIASLVATPSFAQAPSNPPTSSGVTEQFKAGANRVGEGAAQIGEGIKGGAVMTWEAIKAGAAAAAAKFNGSGGHLPAGQGSTDRSGQSH
ncbi:MAG: hypothetical protein ACREF0_05915 [Acetobacteraceae bacterium]